MDCSIGCAWIDFEVLSILEMLVMLFIFLVEWVDGCYECLIYDVILEFRGRFRYRVLDFRLFSFLGVYKIFVVKL